MTNAIENALETFRRDERGTITIKFALMAVFIFLMAGLAIDFGRATQAGTRLEAALDSAALAGAKAIRLQGFSAAESETLTEEVFHVNMANNGADAAEVTALNIDIDHVNSEVQISATAALPAYFGPLAGVSQLTVNRSSTAIFESNDIEIALQLDVTGSMKGSKLQDLKDAVGLLVDAVMPDTPAAYKLRIAIAPYSAGINAGTYAEAITDGTSIAAGSNCVFERKNPALQDSDIAPSGGDSLRSIADLPSNANRKYCPSAEILPLTDDEDAIDAKVQSLSASGVTAGHLGTAWAWYLLSPEWSAVWTGASQPGAYAGTRKFAILMTDGEYNTVNGTGTGWTYKTKSREAAKETCAAMKAKGLVVYTVGFELDQQAAIDVMTECATSETTAFLAEDGDELKAAFNAIANQIITLRLTN